MSSPEYLRLPFYAARYQLIVESLRSKGSVRLRNAVSWTMSRARAVMRRMVVIILLELLHRVNRIIGHQTEDVFDSTARSALLGNAVELHKNQQFEEAGEAYSQLLEKTPHDPDALHLLGLARYGQGKLLREASCRDQDNNNQSGDYCGDENNAPGAHSLFEEAERLVKAATKSAGNPIDAIYMTGNLGEILRAKGDLESALSVLRAVVEDEQVLVDTEVHRRASMNLAITLLDMLRRRTQTKHTAKLMWNDADGGDIFGREFARSGISTMSSRRSDTTSGPSCGDHSTLGSESLAGKNEQYDASALRAEAETLLRRELEIEPHNKDAVLELANLLKSVWESCQHSGAISDDARCRGQSDYRGEGQSISEEVLLWFERALELHPSDAAVALERAVALHRVGRTIEAEDGYEEVIRMEDKKMSTIRTFARSNLAALKQEIGNAEEAAERYVEVLADSPPSAIVLNNLGAALMSIGKHGEGRARLEQALAMDSTNIDVMVNLGVHFQEEGELDRARAYYARAAGLRRNDALAVRRALMLPPIMLSEEHVYQDKQRLENMVDDLFNREPSLILMDPCRGVERVHFYLVYRGGNHRVLQQKIARMYVAASPGLLSVAPFLAVERGTTHNFPSQMAQPSAGASSIPATVAPTSHIDVSRMYTSSSTNHVVSSTLPPLRIGFVSKYFGQEEPHGMLLEGVIRHLPRGYFRVILCPIASPGKSLAPDLAQAADDVQQLPLKQGLARAILQGLRLDVLVYADMNSEPMTHFLGYARLARVQAVFWGNPITTGAIGGVDLEASGNPSIDYFISSEVMEGQHRTLLSREEEPYSEQVVLLSGQAIWYSRPQLVPELAPAMRVKTKAILRRALRSKLDIPTSSEDDKEDEASVVYMCPQSLFKLHPAFDLVLKDILEAFGTSDDSEDNIEDSITSSDMPMRSGRWKKRDKKKRAYLVLTEGRRKKWTEAFLHRLEVTAPSIMSQVRIVPRTAAGAEFHALLASADVVLHPFPFGGSKTAADGLALGLPVVTLVGDALPGRMAYSLYRTMGLDGTGERGCCVATDRESYVALAVRLGMDTAYRRWAEALIDERSRVLWGRRDVVLEWARFLSVASGRTYPAPQEVGLVPGNEGIVSPLPPPRRFQRLDPAREQPNLQQQAETLGNVSEFSFVTSDDSSTTGSGTPPPPPLSLSPSPPPPSSTTGSFLYMKKSEGSLSSMSPFPYQQAVLTQRAAIEHKDLRRQSSHAASSSKDNNRDEDRRRNSIDRARSRNGDVSTLLERFAGLHAAGRLEEAVVTLQRVLEILEQGSQGHEGYLPHHKFAGESALIARVMNDLGCTFQQLWRLDEAETMLRRAIDRNLRYVSAMTNLGVTLQAKKQDEEAERWYWQALRVSPLEGRDSCLSNLALLMRANSSRIEEAVDLISRETLLPPLKQGGLEAAVLSLLELRPGHERAFAVLASQESYTFDLYEEVRRLKTWYLVSTNNLVVFLGLLGRLGNVFKLFQGISGMEPIFSRHDERDLLPPELHTPAHYMGSLPMSDRTQGREEYGERGRHGQDHIRTFAGSDHYSRVARSGTRTRKADKNTHLFHIVTQYYLPHDRQRTVEIDFCLLQNLRNPLVGAVHLMVDLPGRVGEDADNIPSATRGHGRNSSSWESMTWRPSVLRHMGAETADKVHVVRLDRRLTFRDAIQYCNDNLQRQVVILANSDIFFDDSLSRLGDASTLDIQSQVFSLSTWQSSIVISPRSAQGYLHRRYEEDSRSTQAYGYVGGNADDSFEDGTASNLISQALLAFPSIFSPRIDSQDAWIFRSPLPQRVADEASFEMGRPRCDGRFARILIDNGYRVTNPSLGLVAHHLHAMYRPEADGAVKADDSSFESTDTGVAEGDDSTPRTTYSGAEQVRGDIAMVLISDRWLF